MLFHITKVSGNSKTGPIPVTTSPATTCPDSCPLKRNGCYGDGGPLRMHWDKVSAGERGKAFEDYLAGIKSLPRHQLWRENQAGDQVPMASNPERLCKRSLRAKARANRGKRGFTYTHYCVDDKHNRQAIREANKLGFTVNVSMNTLASAIKLKKSRKGAGLPIVAIVPKHHTRSATIGGVRVVVCPATAEGSAVTCATCGLCQQAERDSVVVFPVHGSSKRKAEIIAKSGD